VIFFLAVRQVLDRTVDVFQRHSKARRWLPLRVPELVPLDKYERYMQRRLDERDDALLRELVRVTNLFLPHLAIAQNFDREVFMRPRHRRVSCATFAWLVLLLISIPAAHA